MAIEDGVYPLLRSYLTAPQWIKYLVGAGYRALPSTLRYGSAYARFSSACDMRGRTVIQQYAEERLLETLTWAVSDVPAYRDFDAVVRVGQPASELLSALPLCSKADLKRNLRDYLCGSVPEGKRLPMFTGGSTSEPMMFFLEKAVSRPKETAFIRAFERRLGRQDKDLTLSLRGRTVPAAAHNEGRRFWMYEPIKRQLMLSCDHLERRYMDEYVKAIGRWRPSYIEAFPSALEPLARWFEENPAPDCTAGVKGIMLYSENVSEAQTELFKRVFACPVLKHYGHSERVLMAASMPDDDRYFFWPQYGWLELIDRDGNPVKQPGAMGEIVGTSFDNHVLPFVRYRTGDYGILGEGEHPALPGFPVIEKVAGRTQEFVVCRDRRLLSVTTLGAAHFRELARVEAIQYEQSVPGELILHLACRQELDETALRSIKTAIEQKTQGGCMLHVNRVASIPRTPRGKHKLLTQHLDLSYYFGAARHAVDGHEENPDARHRS